jgi:hypothetical protein
VKNQSVAGPDREERLPCRVRLPGFLIEDEKVGLGDVIKKVTYAMPIKPCGRCEQRAAAMNRWMTSHDDLGNTNRFRKEESR